jgi:acyl-CoA synthetase (NDP forming)
MMNVEEFVKKLKGRKNLTEAEANHVLGKYDIPTPPHIVVKEEKDLEKITFDYPMVMKVCSPNILHKTDVSGVKLNILDEKELYGMFGEMSKRFPGENFLVEKMEEKGIELITGLIKDPTFGLTIMFGIGGIFTEIYKDVTFRLIPIEKYDVEEMLKEIKGAALLEGFRGIKVNRDAVIELMLNVSRLAQDFEEHIDQMDLNPVFAREKDVVVVDAKMILR